MISLYMDCYGVNFKEALKQLAQDYRFSSVKRNVLNESDQQKKVLEVEQSKIQFAQKVYDKRVSIKGTLAEKYLREHRGIQGELSSDFRFCVALKHPYTKQTTPALLAPIRNKERSIMGVVRIFLNQDGSKLKAVFKDAKGHWQKAPSKANLGVMKEGAVIVQQGEFPRTVWVAEGVETALSVVSAKPYDTVLASLSISHLKNVPIGPEVQKVVICADNDGQKRNEAMLFKAVEGHLSQGRRVFIAMPQGNEKCDFNDVLKKEGGKVVKQILDQKVEITSTTKMQSILAITHKQKEVER